MRRATISTAMLLPLLAVSPLYGQEDEAACDTPLTVEDVSEALKTQPSRIMGFEATEAAAELRLLTRNLTCLSEPISAEILGELWFLRGIARLYAAEEGKAQVVAGEDVVVNLFTVAHRVWPQITWDASVYGTWGQDSFEEAGAQWRARAAGGMGDEDALPRFDLGAVPSGVQAWLDGQPITTGEALVLDEGVYLFQFLGGDGWQGAWLRVDDAHQPVSLPWATAAAAVETAPPATSDDATQPAKVVTQQAAPPAATPQAAMPVPDTHASRLKVTALAQTWRLPQLYSGPELGLKIAVAKRLWLGVAAGLGTGPWKDCRSCLATDSTYVLVPIRGDVTLILGEHEPVSLHIAASWQSYVGGGFGLAGESLAASAHGMEAGAGVAIGRGRLRLYGRASAGWTLSPASISGPQASAGLGLLGDFGGMR